MVERPGLDHYEPIGWDEALGMLADELRALDSPNETLFYTSGRRNNDAAFLLQLFARPSARATCRTVPPCVTSRAGPL
ncbi:hypothetical protein FM21_00045 [Streptomyces mutabilis]|uniref:Molybdopterin oxidoreductase domain-containing protein n=1 Tax=Streptomyces mutabilis TaxID=67332 RepID=A0A086MQF9_9ACTN|nr:hypothetical protein FM21_00045 [Streptomyces mutabilis]